VSDSLHRVSPSHSFVLGGPGGAANGRHPGPIAIRPGGVVLFEVLVPVMTFLCGAATAVWLQVRWSQRVARSARDCGRMVDRNTQRSCRPLTSSSAA
jgi:hypothetical protein